MQRIIEENIENRKEAQVNLKETIEKLNKLLRSGFFKKKRKDEIDITFSDLNNNINNLILSYNKEWDSYANNHMTGVIKSLTNKIDKLEAEYINSKNIFNNFIHLEKGLTDLINKLDNKNHSLEPIQELTEFKKKLSLYQYSDFEQRFRGDESFIKDKLKKHYVHFENTNDILDIGCGRGEFLEVIKENKKKGIGIDVSQSMLDIAKKKGLECINIEALEYLKKKEENSIGGIFSSQVIEHFDPEYLRDVIIESFRTLKNGASIVLETINPLSIFALSRIFFLDITHQKPLHPEYMRYLLESSGFYNVEIIYSEGDLKEEKLENISPENELARIYNTNIDKLNNILYSSVEYIVKGIKK